MASRFTPERTQTGSRPVTGTSPRDSGEGRLTPMEQRNVATIAAYERANPAALVACEKTAASMRDAVEG